jgi:hypothetical protein
LGDLVLVGVCTMDHTDGSRHSPWFESLRADEVQTGALKVFNYSAWWAGTSPVPPRVYHPAPPSLHYSRAVDSWTPTILCVAARHWCTAHSPESWMSDELRIFSEVHVNWTGRVAGVIMPCVFLCTPALAVDLDCAKVNSVYS